ncbi:hypothetical protein CU097_010173 [Rhizopus azygosporus]|uniref:Major facilitator superfamily (MFS) profile domain-containing protein n=1 Tax=Rhizopus azygosporus TaxID=86630 RepID=A0A367JFL6_RHIAZ|nr:hypothetical protein CU097_010173 [Rhizopus azygosporus]CEJ02915.1 hypothetical protein RMCBS344292_16907 [Rhizopus microsporus]
MSTSEEKLPKEATSSDANLPCGSATVDENGHAPKEFRTYPQAWVSLFLLVLVRTAVSVFQYTFSVIPDSTRKFYHISLSAVNWLANIQCIIYVFLSFFTGWIFEKLGVKRSIIASGFLCTLGGVIRCVAVKLPTPSFMITMAGQVVGGSASPLSLNIMTMFVSTWFTEKLRATAGMLVASNYGAILVMFVIPAVTVNETYIPMVLNMVAGFALIIFVPLLFMPERPPTPPSNISQSDRPPFIEGIKILCKNINFWILFFIHSFNVGLSIAFCTLCTQILTPHGYTTKEAGALNAFAFFAGTIGCSVAGPVLDMTKQYKLFLRLASPMVFITHLSFYFIVRPNSFSAILFALTLNQFFLSFLVPVVMELSTEVSFPVADATTSSLLWQGAQTFGFIFVVVMDALRDANGAPVDNMDKALIFQASVAGAIVILSFLFYGRLHRSEASAGTGISTKM